MVQTMAARAAEAESSRGGEWLDRIGCSLLTFHLWDLEAALDRVVAHGFRRIDLGIVPGHCDHVDLLRLTDAGRAALAQAVARRGLTISSVNLHPGDMAAPAFDEIEARIRAALALCRSLGVRVLTIPPGGKPPPESWEAAARVVAERVRALLGPAEEARVRLAVEAPHVRTLAEDVAQARRLFALIGDPRVACTFDTSHVQRGHRRPLGDALAELGADVAHVHLRDTVRGEITVTPGKGDCAYGPFLQALQQRGYEGDLSFELEYEGGTQATIERELAFAREHLRRVSRGEPLPFSHRMHQQGWYRAYDYLAWVAKHPKDFVIMHPRLKLVLRPPVRAARHVLRNWVPYREIRYQAGWQRYWKVGRPHSVVSPRRSARAARYAGPTKRVAILGCGYTGGMNHGPGFARLPGVNVVGVCDVRPERAEKLAGQLRCPSFTDAAALLRETRPDLVVNCTREWQHRETTLAAFEAGADVFCEKIMAESLASGEEMVRIAGEKGRVLGLNYNWRFMPGIRKIRALRDGGELGPLRMLRIMAHSSSYHHALDLARYLAGPVASVSATYLDDPAVRGLAAWNPYAQEMLYIPSVYAMATLETREGVGVSIASSELLYADGMLLSVDAVFQEGTVTLSGLLYDDALGSLTASTRKKIDLRLRRGDAPGGFALSFQRSIEAFYESYLRGAPLPTSGEDGLEVMRIEHALSRSHHTGRRVTL